MQVLNSIELKYVAGADNSDFMWHLINNWVRGVDTYEDFDTMRQKYINLGGEPGALDGLISARRDEIKRPPEPR